MEYDNYATLIRQGIQIRIARAFFEGKLLEKIDRIPIEMRPKRTRGMRCCIYKDRAVVKYQCMATIGLGIEEEDDELKSLADYAKQALSREVLDDNILTVIDIACSACIRSRYEVTNACRSCIARPCTANCPRTAIHMENERARIDPERCINCGMCQKVCPYQAIVRIPIPCEDVCPTGAITKDETGKEYIDYDKCIFCGKCMKACPFGAIMERSQMLDVLRKIRDGKTVVAMIAPSIVGQFQGEIGQIIAGLRQLGFKEVVEVALGADMTAIDETAEFIERMEKKERFMTTSCCPSYIEAVKKHIPEIREFVSSTPSPMHYTGVMVKKENPEAVTVFIGPCLAKRKEALADQSVDYVLTFEELDSMFVAKEIVVDLCEPEDAERPAKKEGRGFPVSGGVTRAVLSLAGEKMEIKPVRIDGLTTKTIKLLRMYAQTACPGTFVEVMSCEGGCIAGPSALLKPKAASSKVEVIVNQSSSLKGD